MLPLHHSALINYGYLTGLEPVLLESQPRVITLIPQIPYEQGTGFEPATFCLEDRVSAIELSLLLFGMRGIEPPFSASQKRRLNTLAYIPYAVRKGIEPSNA